MPHRRAFTVIEFIATIVILAVVLAWVLTLMANLPRRYSFQMQDQTQVRGIIQGMINHSPGNNEWYPGLTAQGQEDTAPLTPELDRPLPPEGIPSDARLNRFGTHARGGFDPAYRFAFLIRNQYITPEYLVGTSEQDLSIQPATDGTMLDRRHFSFAMLRIDEPNTGRRGEWRSTTNSRAPVVTDRNRAGAGEAPRSNWSPANAEWRGVVGYNDNHVNFETTHVIADTLYERKDGEGFAHVKADNLLADDNDTRGRAGHDAGMVYQDEKTYVNQK